MDCVSSEVGYLHGAHTQKYAQYYTHVSKYCKHILGISEFAKVRRSKMLCFFHYNCQKIYYIVVSGMHGRSQAHKRCF